MAIDYQPFADWAPPSMAHLCTLTNTQPSSRDEGPPSTEGRDAGVGRYAQQRFCWVSISGAGSGASKMHAPENRNSAGTLLERTLLEPRWNLAGTLLRSRCNLWNIAGTLLECGETSLERACWNPWLEHLARSRCRCGCRFSFTVYTLLLGRTLETWKPGAEARQSTTLEPWNSRNLQPCNPGNLQLWNPGTLESLGTLPYNIATLEPWSLLLGCKAGLIIHLWISPVWSILNSCF